MAKRTKTKVLTGVTVEQANQAMADFATAEANIAKINADLDVKIIKLREAKADEIVQHEQTRDEALKIVQAYATENKDELFIKKKSVETVHGIFGFRTGTPKLKTLKGFTWKAVAKVLEQLAPDYVRKTIEADKEKLLADRDKEGVSDKFVNYGIEVVQNETFYIEPKTEEKDA